MKSFLFHSILLLTLFSYSYGYGAPKTLKYVDKNGKTVVLLKMTAKFNVIENDKTTYFDIDTATASVAVGSTNYIDNNGTKCEVINFGVVWNETTRSNQFMMIFNKLSDTWKWINATFITIKPGKSASENVTVSLQGMIGEFGNGNPIVVNTNNSFYCNSPLDFSSEANQGIKVSVTWSHFRVEVYPRNESLFDSSSSPCTVDFDDKIVPIAVGGALGLLLLLVVIIYVISYIRDRRQQSKELRSGYNRIDHPEPNHHS